MVFVFNQQFQMHLLWSVFIQTSLKFIPVSPPNAGFK